MTKGVIITELEGLEILELYSLSCGEEKETAFYKRKGYINVGSAQDAFMEKLEQVCSYVRHVINEKTGRPFTSTNRLYEIGEFRKELIERYDGRINNGSNTNPEYDIIEKYVFNRLLELKENKSLPYKSWIYKVGMLDTSKISDKTFTKNIKETLNNLHLGTLGHEKKTTDSSIKMFKDVLYGLNRKLIKRSFARLQEKGMVKLTEGYAWCKLDDEREIITKELFEVLEKEEDSILETYGLTRDEYVSFVYSSTHRNENYYKVKEAIAEHMKKKHGIQYYYTTNKVVVLDNDPYEDIDECSKDNAYRRRLVQLTLDRGKVYTRADNLEKEWYVLNTFTMLKEMGIDISEDEYKKELIRLQKDQDSVLFKNKQLDNDIEDGCSIFD